MKRLLWLALAITVSVAAALYLLHLRQRLNAKTTTDRIRVLTTILLVEKPAAVSPSSVAALAAKHGRRDILVDAWGHPLDVRMEATRYVVTSYGRDGKAGGCCVRTEEASPETDLIAVDGDWRQVWN